MHVRISENHTLRKDDIFYQPNQIEKYLTRAKNVLELGPGQGANLGLLASKFPNIQFTGVDLYPSLARKNQRSNIKLIKQDYHDLSQFPDDSFDVIYAIETICHSATKDKLFDEIYRVMKKDGIFIMYDYYASKAFEKYNTVEQKIITLISKGCSAEILESTNCVTQKLKYAGFSKIKREDLTEKMLPDLKRLKRLASIVIHRKTFAKVVFKILPKTFLGNGVVAYVGYNAARNRVLLYAEHIYKK